MSMKWIIGIVVVIFAALALLVVAGLVFMYNLFEPSSLIPEQCNLVAGLNCLEARVTPSGMVLIIENGPGRDVIFPSMSVTEISDPSLHICTFKGISLSENRTVQWQSESCSPANVETGKMYSYDIELEYKFSETSFPHTAQGSLTKRIK